MLARVRNQLIRSLLRLGRPTRRDGGQALVDQRVGERVTMDGLSGVIEPLLDGSPRLIGVAAVPECQPSGALGGNADVCTKPERKLPVLLWPIQCDRAIEVAQRRRVISPSKHQCRADEAMADQQYSGLCLSLGEFK